MRYVALWVSASTLLIACGSGAKPSATGGTGGAAASDGSGGRAGSGGRSGGTGGQSAGTGGGSQPGSGGAGSGGRSGSGGQSSGSGGQSGGTGGESAGTGGQSAGSGGQGAGSGGRSGGTGGRNAGSGGQNGGTGGRGTGGALPPGTGGASGAGGTVSGTATLPLAVSADSRYLVGANGVPFLVAGDSPQALATNLSTANYDAYFAARAAQGFNAAWVNLLVTTYTGGRTDATTYDGIAPFTATVSNGDYDLSAPNPGYFARIDALLAAAAAHGIVVFLDPIEFGGFNPTMTANTQAAARGYGRFLGARYRGQANIVWMHGNDMAGYNMVEKFVAVALGLEDGGATQLQTAELDWPALSATLDDPSWIPANAPTSLNLDYTYNPTYALLLRDYNRSPHLPNIFIEGNYEGENLENGPHVTNAHDIRAQAYWSDLSGATGWFYGNHWEVYAMDNSSWQTSLAGDKGAPQMIHVKTLFEARRWWQLVPDQAHAVVTSGSGTCMPPDAAQGGGSPNAEDDPCATTARTPDGALVITYMPSARDVVVDMTKLGARATARWYDPTTGTFTTVTGSPLANTGTMTFSPPTAKHADGYSDWVLVLETSPP